MSRACRKSRTSRRTAGIRGHRRCCSNLGPAAPADHGQPCMVVPRARLRILSRQRPQPRAGLFLYRLDERRGRRGRRALDGGQPHAWLGKTLAASDEDSARRDPDDHGLTFSRFSAASARSAGIRDAKGVIAGLTFEQATAREVSVRLRLKAFAVSDSAAIADLLARAQRDRCDRWRPAIRSRWIRSGPTLSPVPSRRRGSTRRRCARACGCGPWNASVLGTRRRLRRFGEVFHPREDRADAYRSAREASSVSTRSFMPKLISNSFRSTPFVRSPWTPSSRRMRVTQERRWRSPRLPTSSTRRTMDHSPANPQCRTATASS